MIDSETQDDVGKVANENRILNEFVTNGNATSSFTSLHPDELIAGIHVLCVLTSKGVLRT